MLSPPKDTPGEPLFTLFAPPLSAAALSSKGGRLRSLIAIRPFTP